MDDSKIPRPSDPVTGRLLASRVELLDLTLRNPLLNWRPSVRRGIEVVDESSKQVFSTLYLEGQSLRFHPIKVDPPKGPAEAPAAERMEVAEFEVGTGEANPANSLATLCTKADLARRLQATHYDARTSIEEQGANILFLALGMLRWRDGESPDERLAPLVLVPVRLERKTARAAWHLLAADEDPGANLSLVEKLKEFGLRIPAEPDLETVEGLEAFFAEVEHAVGEKEGWGVDRNRIVLGFFSFGKFLMYRDLDPAVWPPGRSPSRHEILAGLLVEGFRDPGSVLGPDELIDLKRPPGKTMEVMDSDGSQAEALADVAAGRNLVIQGPPGTGKSQTISNLIAEAVHAGKTVLFVAEKMAALEVVKRRLDNVGLGDLCLELHSSKASKKEVAADLSRTLALGKPVAPAGAELVEGLPALREQLNRYAKAASLPVGATGMTPFQAIGILERLAAGEPLPNVESPALVSWDAARYAEARRKAEELAAQIAGLGRPKDHPFAGCGLVELLPGETEKLAPALDQARTAGQAMANAARALAKPFGAEPAADPASLEAWIRLAALALEAPDLRGVPSVGPAWDRTETVKALEAAVEAGRALAKLRKDNEPRLLPQAWDQDLLQTRADLVADGSSFWRRLFSGRYRAAKRRVQGLSHAPFPSRPYELLTAANAVLEGQRLKGEVEKRSEAARALLGPLWQGGESDWEALAKTTAWAVRFRAHLASASLPAALADWVVGPWDREELKSARALAERALEAWRAEWTAVGTKLAFRGDLAAQPFARGVDRAALWRSSLPKLPSYVAYWKSDRAVAALGIEALGALAHDGTLAGPRIPEALDQAWARRVAEEAFRDRPELREFNAASHEQAVERFRAADAATFASNRARLAEVHWKGLPGLIGYGQVGLVRREGAKKARHLPIRRLLEEAGRAVQQVKPVFLMSPLSIAAYLPPDGPEFDLVVFDEASQVKPVDAFGAILRGRRLVVVGDEKQMPPTSFFDAMLDPGDRKTEEDEAETSVTQDLQSILGLCTSRGMPSRMLRWHYRSRHDSLIALSNREFYDSHLVIFPSPRRSAEGEGLLFRHLPDTAYERGTSRTNPREAEAVAQAALEHAKARPELSLGIVAFSMAQRGAIEDRIEALCRKDAAFDAFVRESREEPFFVKNLENVQGDERDVMLISVGYGRDEKGAVSMNFGPLNQAGGERRLNVLITRARRQCVVFTNLTADDLDLRRAAGEGVRVFKSFLAFARDGRLEAAAAKSEAGSDFEEQVRRALGEKGYGVEPQVGSGGFRVDLGLVEPGSPGRYLLGIESDGAKYHSARWARDRDRLRESVLRSLGWTIHRVWSADWFRSREEALRRLVEAVERARQAKAAPKAVPALVSVTRSEVPPPGREAPPAYAAVQASANIGDRHLADVNPEKLAEFVAAIVSRESPVHAEEVRRRVLEAIDARTGSKRVAAIDEAVERAVSRGLVRRKGEFLWGRQDREVVPRDRTSLPDASRDLGLVAFEERQAALRRVVEESCGCTDEEAAVQAIKLLGVKRNEEAVAQLQGLARSMVGEGALARSSSGSLLPAKRNPS